MKRRNGISFWRNGWLTALSMVTTLLSPLMVLHRSKAVVERCIGEYGYHMAGCQPIEAFKKEVIKKVAVT